MRAYHGDGVSFQQSNDVSVINCISEDNTDLGFHPELRTAIANSYADRRGLVVGQVQSGKTAHYTGLICKAADAGYRLIVVMAGVHNNLRSQTQLRLDEGFYGFDSRERRLLHRHRSR